MQKMSKVDFFKQSAASGMSVAHAVAQMFLSTPTSGHNSSTKRDIINAMLTVVRYVE